MSYLIELEDERVVRRHVDHVKMRVPLVEPVPKHNDDVEELLPSPRSEAPEIQTRINAEADLPSTSQRPVRTHKRPARLIEELN